MNYLAYNIRFNISHIYQVISNLSRIPNFNGNISHLDQQSTILHIKDTHKDFRHILCIGLTQSRSKLKTLPLVLNYLCNNYSNQDFLCSLRSCINQFYNRNLIKILRIALHIHSSCQIRYRLCIFLVQCYNSCYLNQATECFYRTMSNL